VGIALEKDDIAKMPDHLENPKAVLWDKRTSDRFGPTLIYVFEVPGEGKLGRFAVRINLESKRKGPSNVVIHGQEVDAFNLKDHNSYPVLNGSLE
jgi:hypothetical protein